MPQPARPSRRTLLAGAAWSAPAILLTSAVPAAAASTTTVGTLNYTHVQAARSRMAPDYSVFKAITVQGAIIVDPNSGQIDLDSDVIGPITLVVELPDTIADGQAANIQQGAPYWTVSGAPSLNGSLWTYTFTYEAFVGLNHHSTSNFVIQIPSSKAANMAPAYVDFTGIAARVNPGFRVELLGQWRDDQTEAELPN